MLLPYSARLRAAGVHIVLASLSPRRRELMGLLLPPAPRSAAEDASAGASSAVGSVAASASSSAAAAAAAAASVPLPVPFSCVPSTFAEDLSHALYPSASSYACATSLAKAREVWARVGAQNCDILIAADTVVTLDGKILEKPDSHDGAFAMLRSLSGRSHIVATGVTLLVHRPAEPATAAAAAAASSSSAAVSPCSGAAASSVASSSSSSSSDPELHQFSVETEVTFAELSDEVIRAYAASNEPMDKAGGYGYQSLASTFVRSIRGCYFNVVGFPLFDIAARIKPLLERILEQKEAKAKSTGAPAQAAAAAACNDTPAAGST